MACVWFDDPLPILAQTSLVERFLRYVRIDTQVSAHNPELPTSPGQFTLARLLERELQELGLADAAVDQHAHVFATFPGRAPGPTVGLLAHLDTAPDFPGAGVQPRSHRDYDGKKIYLENGVILDPAQDPLLGTCRGHTIITSDGTTLLGADDKAGIAEIMALLEFLSAHPEIPCPKLRVGFTPDEEISRGSEKFDIAAFGAELAYTVDNIDGLGGINDETFNAERAVVIFEGVAVHPGYAKGRMVNALDWAARLIGKLPPDEQPETTEGRQGYFYPAEISGTPARAKLLINLRDFEDAGMEDRKARLRHWIAELQAREPRLKITVEMQPRYRNMRRNLRQRPALVEKGRQALLHAGLTPVVRPVRGGTDGGRLTALGLLTPNLFSGAVNGHGPREWVSDRVMGLAVCTLLNLGQLWTLDEDAQAG